MGPAVNDRVLPPIRLGKGMRRYACPFCGRLVLCSDQSLSVHHDAPTCAAFAAKMRELGLRPQPDPTVFVLDGPPPAPSPKERAS
jgi:hypothetical protein